MARFVICHCDPAHVVQIDPDSTLRSTARLTLAAATSCPFAEDALIAAECVLHDDNGDICQFCSLEYARKYLKHIAFA